MKNLHLLALVFLGGCFKAPIATMTDQYIEVVKPGQVCGLVELSQVIVDSTFGYPVQEEEGTAYSIVDRRSKLDIDGNSHVKIYLNKKHQKYMWKIWGGPHLSDFSYGDTIQLKPFTWYRLTTEKYGFHVYFFLDKSKKTYLRKLKPKPGAW